MDSQNYIQIDNSIYIIYKNNIWKIERQIDELNTYKESQINSKIYIEEYLKKQVDRKRDRQVNRKRDRKVDRKRDRWQIEREIDRQRDR